MRRFFIFLFSFFLGISYFAQDNSLLKKEIQDHYKKYKIEDIKNISEEMRNDIPLGLGRTQNLLNSFYKDQPANIKYEPDTNLENTLERQLDPSYSANPRLDQVLRKIRQKQIPRFIKDAPNIFLLHVNMARGLMIAEKNGIIFTQNPETASYYYFTALRYRSLRLTPEIWTDPERLELLNDDKETQDAQNFLKVKEELEKAQNDLAQTKKKLFAQEDNNVKNLQDPGNNEPMYSNNQKTLQSLQSNIDKLKNEMAKQFEIFDQYAKKYNKESADYLLELANIVLSVDNNLRDKEKILNAREYYQNNYNSTYKQTWKLESRKSSFIDLLETASLLDPENPLTSYRLGKEYYLGGDKAMAITSFEVALKKNKINDLLLEENIIDTYRYLGGLYYSTRRYVDSAYYYQELLNLKDSDETRLELARIHTENTGNYDAARTLLIGLLEKIPPNTNTPEERVKNLKNEYNVRSLLITVYEKTGQKKELMDTLNASHKIHLELRKILSTSYDNLYQSEKTLVNSRAQMNINPGEESMQKFYTDEEIYQKNQEQVRLIESTLKTMNFEKIYFTMAHENEIHHNIEGAINAYRLAESYGVNPDFARREIMRLGKKY